MRRRASWFPESFLKKSRILVQFCALLLAGVGCLAAQSKNPADLAVGKILVATRGGTDSIFEKSVILLVRYDQTRALGLMVNRRSTVYPSKVFGTAISGTVWIALTVGSDGKVSDAVPMGATIPGMGPIALEAVRSWRFRPAHGPDGKIVAVRLTVEIQFRMF